MARAVAYDREGAEMASSEWQPLRRVVDSKLMAFPISGVRHEDVAEVRLDLD